MNCEKQINSPSFSIMPFRFSRFRGRVLITNEAGEYHFVDGADIDNMLSSTIDQGSDLFLDLKSKNFVAQEDLAQAIEMTATRYSSRKNFLRNFTSLHMMVITLRCNHRCEYCQVSCEDSEAYKYDMSVETAKRIVDYIFLTPSPQVKIEFQGGEPLLNWNVIEETVRYSQRINKTRNKLLEFVICTNLTLINEDQIKFCKDNNIYISTSLDGPKPLHDTNRKLRNGESSYDLFLKKLSLAYKFLPEGSISALMTTSSASLFSFPSIIDEYIKHGFKGVFFRSLNPYGFAAQKAAEMGYPAEEFVKSFIEGIEYLFAINKNGVHFNENYFTLLLTRILTPYSTGFVDLQSPSGAGISGVIYDFNGNVYPADEARMLSRMGDSHFLMGNVFSDSYTNIFKSRILNEIVEKSCLEMMPICADCVYLPYCGSDPIRNYLEHKDIMGKRPGSFFCEKHRKLFDYIFGLLHDGDDQIGNILWSWVTKRPLREIANEIL